MEYWLEQKEKYIKSSTLKNELTYMFDINNYNIENIKFFYLEIINFLKKNKLESFSIYYVFDGEDSDIQLYLCDNYTQTWNRNQNEWFSELFKNEEIIKLKNIICFILNEKDFDPYNEQTCDANIVFTKDKIEVDYNYYYMAEGNDYSEINLN